MVWSGYAVLMSGKTDSIKINNNPGCLLGSTFVYNEVFKLDFLPSSGSYYALWDVIENGNSFKPVAETTTDDAVAETTTDDAGTSTTIIPGLVTIEENAKKKNDVKARSMLLMALTNEHLMTFNQYKDAKYLFAAIETRFGGNEANKKTQKTFLKQLYENFSATDIESLDLIFNRLQKLVSQLAILGVFFS
nr:ribonuclease H-like domain-containing protein [Tanacetum cinerariifolium]